ncbi:MAG: glycosyltransferase family 39 protein, partial [Nitrospinaceae bacterium]|nr:glycosyltransferase family 39 protein [Nitrospinaceae bacterium]
MDGAPLFYYYSDKNYHGITIGLAAIPFFWVLGVNALAYKLPAIMFHSFYILTAYFIAKRIDKEIGLLVAFLMLMASPCIVGMTTQNWPHHLIALLGNIMFLILIKLKLCEQKNNKRLIFLLFLTAGFSIYTYTYSILFIFTVFVLLILTHESWQEIRSRIFKFNPKTFINSENNRIQKIVHILDLIIILFIFGILFSYVFGGFGLDIAGISIFQINKLHKPVFQLIILLIARYLICKSDLKQKLSQAKQFIKTFNPEAKSILIISLSGFVIGILPRILSIVSGQVKRGGQGFDIDFSPIKLALHFQHLFITSFPELLGLRAYIHELITSDEASIYHSIMATVSIALLGLFLTAAFSFLFRHSKSIKNIFKIKALSYKPELILIIFFITVCGANIISQTGSNPRYIYPLHMVLIIWVALYLKAVKKKSPAAFILIL